MYHPLTLNATATLSMPLNDREISDYSTCCFFYVDIIYNLFNFICCYLFKNKFVRIMFCVYIHLYVLNVGIVCMPQSSLKSSLELVLNEEGRKKYFRDFGIKPFLLGYEIYQSKLSLLLLLPNISHHQRVMPGTFNCASNIFRSRKKELVMYK